jgi:hypothetical protein
MDIMYKQCLLRKNNTFQTAWIPTKFAHINHCVKLKDEDGWIVQRVFSTSSEKYLRDHERDFKNQRSASDI